MSGVEHDGEHAIHCRFAGARRLNRLRRGLVRQFRIDLERLNHLLPPFQQSHQGIGRRFRIHIEHQTVTILTHRRQRKHLWRHPCLQFHHQAHHPRLETSCTQQLDMRVVFGNLAGNAFQHAIELDPFDIDHQPIRIFDREMVEFQWRIMLQGDAGVIRGRPDAHGDNGRPVGGMAGQWRYRNNQCGAGAAQELAPGMFSCLTHDAPLSEQATNSMRRPSPACCSEMRRSGDGTQPAALSGHSTRQTDAALKYSSKPASRNSSADSKR